MKKEQKGLHSNSESTQNPNQATHVKNQNENHNSKKVALGPNTEH